MSAIRTLIIDDDVAVAGIHHGFLLARGGFDVVAMAHTGQQGLDLAAELGPELVLLDIHLPDMSGLDVLQRLRGRRRPVDVLVITASRELDTVRGAMAGGVLHYLVKPFSSQALIERLDEYVMLREELASGAAGPLDQASIDRLVAPSRRAAVAEPPAGQSAQPVPPGQPAVRLPKGLSRPTLDAVIEALKASPEDVSAAGLALQLGLSRVSARRYLEYLVVHGHARLTPRYGAAGRPENRYLWRR
ncbi:two-component system, CitB family, response regulator [Arthrobacter sp. ov407]|uniref:response regulator n=1 Tax=Arthrobacter sp. ov407 TaxID=1761748 RepID=UPI0008923FA7|nr:response regulator [Arthrobacter sp. ov407]SDK67708.1 two-component system, CitB family, response regulator [Arthrobacter sp. ov407]